MSPVTRDGNGEGEVIGCGHFWKVRGGGGEAASRCRWRMTKQRAARRLASRGRR
jgi:hypothetical protein